MSIRRASARGADGSTVIVRRESPPDTPPTDLDRRTTQGTEAALALYRAIFVNSTEAIAIVDPEGRYLEQNVAHQTLLGWSSSSSPFVQLQHGFTRRAEGTGLGLSISRELARAMGGDLSVTSTEGEGATFELILRTAAD